jgi:kynurenine formamidase
MWNPVLQGGTMRIIDLTLQLDETSLSYPGTTTGIALQRFDPVSQGCTVSCFDRLDPHCGTHLDAPLHFVPGASDVASLPLILPDILVLPAPYHSIPVDTLPSPCELEDKAVLFATGWERHAGTKRFFDDFPFLDRELAQRLANQRPALVGLDSPSVDDRTGDHPVHRILLSAGIPIVEGLVNLMDLHAVLEAGERARLAAFPLRIHTLEGSPVRAVAIVD